mmetsp:Transcript_9239/g.27516  ORF Transcript_9239/g.27516 Transcript_9239/m.27516 type:complete len:208 (+) Transcript_9239:176-799(+)
MAPPPKRFIKNSHGVNVLNPKYIAWKKKGGKRGPPPPREPPIARMIVVIEIIDGKDLVAMDRSGLFGKKSSSDPYVKVLMECTPPPSKTPVPARSRHQSTVQKIKLGKTPVVKKSLNPTWNHMIKTAVPYDRMNEKLQLIFNVFDEDKMSSDDSMGAFAFPPLEWKDKNDGPIWYEIPKGSAKKVSGSIRIRLQTHLVRMQGMNTYC